MRIGLVSKEFKNKDIEFNINQIKETAIQYKNKNIDFLCFGEAFLQGFDAFTWEVEHDQKIAISKNSYIIEALKKIAKINHVGLAFGYLEKEDKTFYSSYIFINSYEQEIYKYRRYTKGWKENGVDDNIYLEGNKIGQFNYRNKKITVGLCGDFWDEGYDYVKKVSEMTKDIVIWPVYINFSLTDWEKEESVYAKQSLLFGDKVLMINSISKLPRSFGGCFDFQNGHTKQKLPFDVEGVLFVEV